MRISVQPMMNLKGLALASIYCRGEKRKAVRLGRKWFCTHCGDKIRIVD